MNTEKIVAEAIAKEYAPKDTSKLIPLKKLYKKAKTPANVFAYTFGIISCLVSGLGMCLSMQVIGNGVVSIAVGIIIGILGFIGCGVNYSIYQKILKKGKAKYAYEIIELARQISED